MSRGEKKLIQRLTTKEDTKERCRFTGDWERERCRHRKERTPESGAGRVEKGWEGKRSEGRPAFSSGRANGFAAASCRESLLKGTPLSQRKKR